MKHAITLVAAAGLASVLALPASTVTASAQTGQRGVSGLHNHAQAGHTDISARRYHNRHGYYGHYGYRHHYWGPRYGYYRPYGYGPYAYSPGVSFGFYGGPRLGVWF
jgi:hypothetical protein